MGGRFASVNSVSRFAKRRRGNALGNESSTQYPYPDVAFAASFGLATLRSRGAFSFQAVHMATPYKLGWQSFKFQYGAAAFKSPIQN